MELAERLAGVDDRDGVLEALARAAEARVEELMRERDAYIQNANQHVAGYNALIAEKQRDAEQLRGVPGRHTGEAGGLSLAAEGRG